MPSTAVMSHNATDNRWSTACETGDDPRAVGTFGLRRSDKTSIAPQRPTRRGSDMSEAPPAFCSSQRKQSQQIVNKQLKSPKKQQHDDSSKKKKESSAKKSPKKNVEPIAPPVIVQDKKNFEDSLKRLELEDITETEHTDELSDSDPLPTTRSPTRKLHGTYNNNNELNISVHTAPACVSRSPKKPIDRNDRYANFDSGFGEKRESRMRRVQRINSSDRVMPSLESQQRAIANSRRKKDGAKIIKEEELHVNATPVESCSSNLVVNDLNLSVHTAPADVRRYKHTNKTSSLNKDERYANFDSGFGEKRESRMRRVQRIKSSDRVMPSWESQQRAIANSRRSNGNAATAAEKTCNRLQQELESVRSSPRMSIKDRMAIFSGSSSELSTPL